MKCRLFRAGRFDAIARSNEGGDCEAEIFALLFFLLGREETSN